MFKSLSIGMSCHLEERDFSRTVFVFHWHTNKDSLTCTFPDKHNEKIQYIAFYLKITNTYSNDICIHFLKPISIGVRGTDIMLHLFLEWLGWWLYKFVFYFISSTTVPHCTCSSNRRSRLFHRTLPIRWAAPQAGCASRRKVTMLPLTSTQSMMKIAVRLVLF